MISDVQKKLQGEKRRRCCECNNLTYDWEREGWAVRCWSCLKMKYRGAKGFDR